MAFWDNGALHFLPLPVIAFVVFLLVVIALLAASESENEGHCDQRKLIDASTHGQTDMTERTVRDALLCRVLVRLCCKYCVVTRSVSKSVSVGPPMSFLLSSRRTLPLSSRSSSRSSRPPSGERTLSTTIKDNKRREVQAGAPASVVATTSARPLLVSAGSRYTPAMRALVRLVGGVMFAD